MNVKMEGGDDNDEDEDDDEDNDDEEKGRQQESKGHDSGPGTPSEPPAVVPLPDKKTLELILDKLQKKDIYGVYAEPVDPEELPDYHEIIEHPMDFATVRKKLNNDSYSTLEQLESDVYLICANAMQYNAPDTIYYKQARTIQELARKKFLKVRIVVERSEKELKSEQKTISNSLPKKQIKRLVCRTSQEPVGSDFSSGATLATVVDVQNSQNITQPGGGERPSNPDGFIEGNSSMVDNNLEKAEEVLIGKGILSKFGRKPIVMDENRRTTYNISNQPMAKSDSIYTTFEGEQKQLVAVGLHAEYSYARSLARFSATLGPFAWKAASKRIEQALPEGFKFGRGWVGEYEPLPTPVLMINHSHKEPAFFKKLQCTAALRTDDTTSNTSECPATGPTFEGKPSLFVSAGGPSLEGNPSFFGFNGTRPRVPFNTIDQQHDPPTKNHDVPGNKVMKQVELNFPSTANQNKANFVAEKPLSISPKMAASRATEAVSRDMSLLQTVPVKKQNTNGSVSVGLTNGKVINNSLDSSRLVSSSSDSVPNQITRLGTYSPHGQEQSISNPAQLMRTLAGKARKQPTSSNNSPRDSSPVMSPVSSSRRDDPNNAAATAARAWMSIGAGGLKSVTENSNPPRSQSSADPLYNPPGRDLHPQMLRFRGESPVSGGMPFPYEQNSFPVQAFVPQPVRMATEAQFQNRPTVFPHLVTADLSRFQVQTPWRGRSPHTQPRHKRDTLPPDLNISFQSSSGSPVRQSAGVVDSQQPDLALQL